MKRKYLDLIILLSANILMLNAQTQTISFEASEGYNIGNIIGQNGWQIANTSANTVFVTNEKSTTGSNSLRLQGNNVNSISLFKDVSGLIGNNDAEISFDFYYENYSYGSCGVDIVSENGSGIGSFKISNTALAVFSKPYNLMFTIYGPQITPNTWNSVKIITRYSSNNVDYYVNGTYVGGSPLYLESTGGGGHGYASKIYFNHSLSYNSYFDNIKISNLGGTLSTIESSKKEGFTLFPNPAKNEIYLKGINKAADFSIHAIDGKQVERGIYQPGKAISISELVPGAYIITVDEKNIKFIKH